MFFLLGGNKFKAQSIDTLNCLSQNVSVDTVRKVKNESRVLVRVVQEKSRHNFEFRVLLRKP